jgi:hypothetical protein
VILREVTKDLPDDHPYKICPDPGLMTAEGGGGTTTLTTGTIGNTSTAGALKRPPAVSLTRFLNDTAKRRRLSLEQSYSSIGDTVSDDLIKEDVLPLDKANSATAIIAN